MNHERKPTGGNFTVGVVGPREEILCFRAVGAKIFPTADAQEAVEILKKIKRSHEASLDGKSENDATGKIAVVFVMESLMAKIPSDEMQKVSAGPLPAIIALPGHRGASGAGNAKIARLVEKAVGSDIFAD